MSLDAELTLLSALCKDASEFSTLDLQESDFSTVQTAAIFRQVAKHHKAQIQPDITLIWEGLQVDGESGCFDGLGELVDALNAVGTVRNIKAYARSVKSAAKRNAIADLAAKIYEVGANDGNLPDALAEVRNAIAEYEASTEFVDEGESSFDVIVKTIGYLDKIWQGDHKVNGIPCGVMSVDEQSLGWQDGDLIVVAGRPSMGKTTFALYCALQAALRKFKTHFISLEMSKVKIGLKLMSAQSGIPASVIKHGMTKSQMVTLQEANQTLGLIPLTISDSANTIAKVCSLARRLRMKGGLDFLVIDQLSAMKITGTNRATGLKEITGELKQLAKELKIPIMLLHQINREVAKVGDKRPDLQNLKDSGAVEEDSDMVLMLHREAYYDQQANPEECEVIFGKHREGERGYVARVGLDLGTGIFKNNVGSWNAPKQEQKEDWQL